MKHANLDNLRKAIAAMQRVESANDARENRIKIHKHTRSHKDALRAQEATTAALKAELEVGRG